MKQRIWELCDQAEVYANDSTKDFTGDEPVVWMDYYTEKFVELIVRECLEQVRDEVQHEYDWKLADAVIKRVLEHFGVE